MSGGFKLGVVPLLRLLLWPTLVHRESLVYCECGGRKLKPFLALGQQSSMRVRRLLTTRLLNERSLLRRPVRI